VTLDHPLSFTSDWKPAAACPAAWHAERVTQEYVSEPRECFATGSLFHAVLLTPGRVPAVFAEYGDLLTLTRASGDYKKGDPNKDARDIMRDAAYARALPEVAMWLDGATCEEEVSFDLDGTPWVCHIDMSNEGCILDAKKCKDVMGLEYLPARGRRVIWHVAMLYWYQLAVYRRAKRAEGGIGILALQPTDDVPEVRIIPPIDRDYDIIDGYAKEVEASMRHAWTSPITGTLRPPFVEMLACGDAASLAVLCSKHSGNSRCESNRCGWCRKSRQNLYFPYAFERSRGV